MQDGHNISCGITIETTFIPKNRVENTILAKLLQNTELALRHKSNERPRVCWVTLAWNDFPEFVMRQYARSNGIIITNVQSPGSIWLPGGNNMKFPLGLRKYRLPNSPELKPSLCAQRDPLQIQSLLSNFKSTYFIIQVSSNTCINLQQKKNRIDTEIELRHMIPPPLTSRT
jgi:hypothetical protein